jgi:hypothetical protein
MWWSVCPPMSPKKTCWRLPMASAPLQQLKVWQSLVVM